MNDTIAFNLINATPADGGRYNCMYNQSVHIGYAKVLVKGMYGKTENVQ